MSKCSSCGADVADKAKFCALCGAKTESASGPLLPEHVAPQVVLAERYKILRQLGVEGTGVVWLAQDIESNLPVAVKILPRIVTDTEAHMAEVKRRSDLWLRLDHPNLAHLYALELAPFPFLVVEHIDGRSARDVLTERIEEGHKKNVVGHFPMEEVRGILPGLVAGLDHAHQREVLHLDVCPANVVLCQGKTGAVAKLTNFGITALIRDTAIHPSKQMKQLNDGVPVYMAPEQIQSKPVDNRADVYCLGVTIFHLLSGQHPFLTRSQIGIASSMPSAPKIPIEVHAVLQQAMARLPNNRPQSGTELWESLERACGGTPAPAAPAPQPAPLAASPVPVQAAAAASDAPADAAAETPSPRPSNPGEFRPSLVGLRRERDSLPPTEGAATPVPVSLSDGGATPASPVPGSVTQPAAAPEGDEWTAASVIEVVLLCAIVVGVIWLMINR